MQNILDYIPYVIYILNSIVAFLNMVFIRKTGKYIDTEVSQIMKCRLPSYREEIDAEAQTFSPLVPQYRYNKSSGEIEQMPDMLDVQKLVDSSLQTSLEAMFDKFLSPDENDLKQTYIADTRDTLDRLTDAMDFVENVKDELNLDEFASMDDVKKILEEKISSKQNELANEEKLKKAKADEDALFAKFKQFMSLNGGGNNE